MDISFLDRSNVNRKSKWSFLDKLEDLPEDQVAVIPTDPDRKITLVNIRSQINSRYGSGNFRVQKAQNEDGDTVAHVFRRIERKKQPVTLNGN